MKINCKCKCGLELKVEYKGDELIVWQLDNIVKIIKSEHPIGDKHEFYVQRINENI